MYPNRVAAFVILDNDVGDRTVYSLEIFPRVIQKGPNFVLVTMNVKLLFLVYSLALGMVGNLVVKDWPKNLSSVVSPQSPPRC